MNLIAVRPFYSQLNLITVLTLEFFKYLYKMNYVCVKMYVNHSLKHELEIYELLLDILLSVHIKLFMANAKWNSYKM